MNPKENPLADDLNLVLVHTRTAWEALRNRRIFITGGTGFFGCWMLESFLWANRELSLNSSVEVLTRDPEAFCRKHPHLGRDPKVVLHHGDVQSFEFPSGDFACVIHAATEANVKKLEESPLKTLDSMIQGTWRTLDFATQRHAMKFLYVSSGAVYGKQPSDLQHIPEDYSGAPTTTDPRSAYGEGKRVGEMLSAMYHQAHGLHVTIARCFAFLGPYMPLDQTYAAGNFIRDVLERKEITVAGDGTAIRSYLYAADLMIWLWTILFKGAAGRVYNVGSSQEISISELAHTIAAFGKPIRGVSINGRTSENTILPRYVPCIFRIQTELHCRKYIELSTAIEKTMDWNRMRITN